MGQADHVSLVERFFSQGFNEGDIGALSTFIHPNHRNHDPTAPEVPYGPEGVRRLVELYRRAFPDIHFEHEDLTSVGDKVAHRWTFTGTHRGEIMGIEPTGRSVAVQGIEVNRIADGKIAESWAISDALGMLEQLGAEIRGPAAGAWSQAKREASGEARKYLSRVGLEEPLVTVADLVHVQLVDAGIGELLDRPRVALQVGPAGNGFGEHVLGHELGGLLEVLRHREHLGELSRQPFVRPESANRLSCLGLVGPVADLEAALDELAAPSRGAKAGDQIGVGHGDAVAVADTGGQIHRLGSET
jgi:predicted ester cyclase